MNNTNVTIRVDKDVKKQAMKHTSRSELMNAAEEDEEAIREFLGLAAEKIGYDSFANWVRSKID